MEYQLFSFLGLFIFIFLSIVVKSANASKSTNSTRNLPPGPWRLPILGNTHQLVGSLPHHSLRDLARKHGPLMHLKLGEVSTVVVSSPEIAREVFRTHDSSFASRPPSVATEILTYNYMDMVFAPHGNYWRQLRKIFVMELLSMSRVRSFQSIREEEMMNLVKDISSSAGSPVNLSKKITSMSHGITLRAAFGKISGVEEEYLSLTREIAKHLSGFSVADLYPSALLLQLVTGFRSKSEKMHQRIDAIIQNVLDEHKDRKTKTGNGERQADEDLVDFLLRHQQDGDLEFPVTDDTIKAVIWDVFMAGAETWSAVVLWAISEMLKNPTVMNRAQSEVRHVYGGKGTVDEPNLHELKFVKAVIKETMRLYPPAPLVPRECCENCEINGYKIPAKTKVIINSWAIGRDAKYWTEAEKFYPERFLDGSLDYKGTDFEYMPFGGGRRICPGMSFAAVSMELSLAQFLYHFDWKLPNGLKEEDLDMTESFGLTVTRKEDLILIPIRYHPLSAK